ncbi:MAG: phytanoyl-CoA dioxygenase family protein [Blastocatellia bacterium]
MRQIIKNGRKIGLIWRYGFNFLPSMSFRLHGNRVARNGERDIVNKLWKDGIAITSVEEFLGGWEKLAEFEKVFNSMRELRRDEIQDLKSKADDERAIGEKVFNLEMLGSTVEFDDKSPIARLALDESILSIANSYFGMIVKLRYYNIWHTFATNGSARESQLWHFDREDQFILKTFLYLSDVDEGAGPFTYAPATHRKGSLWDKRPEYSLENGVMRSTDEQMSAVVPSSDWIKAVGKKGTIVFADTRGYHKGGEARTSDRLMFTSMYTSPASDSKRLLDFSKRTSSGNLTKSQLRALEID